jgi:hypothetical protein
MKGFFNMLELLAEATGSIYSSYYTDVKDEMFKLFDKYVQKFGGAATAQRVVHPSVASGKRKQAWERIFGGPSASPTYPPSSSSTSSGVSELSSYLYSDPLTCYDDSFDILLWWRDHKLAYPVLYYGSIYHVCSCIYCLF